MCKCINVMPSSYGNETIVLDLPEHMKATLCNNRDSICIDTCLLDEVQYLWSLGITTTGCCCGHNYVFEGMTKPLAFIGVIDSDISRMKELGYTVQPNQNDLTREDSFKPKTVY